MKNFLRIIIIAMSLTVSVSSCQDDNSRAEELMVQIRSDFEAGNYAKCLKEIDSLRTTYPKAIDARKEALIIHQNASLKMAQDHLADVDRRLQALETTCDSLSAIVELHKQQGCATAEELHLLNISKIRRDSLKGIFDVECSKIRYIHKRQQEND